MTTCYPPNQPTWRVIAVRVATAGQPVQGPNRPIPDGFTLSVRMRRHSSVRTGYIAPAKVDLQESLARAEFRDNDSIELQITNMNLCWFDASTGTNTDFELVAEQATT